jgi:hypothetical protein
MRQAFGPMGGRTLIAWGGTEFFCSQKLGCPHCLTRKRANGKAETSLSAVSDARRARPLQGRPLTPGFIAP